MKRALVLAAVTAFSVTAYAEDSVSVWGNYYKERSTRVIAPSVAVTKDVPGGVELRAGYLVDQVTSASGHFTGTGRDEAFTEYRQELSIGARKKIEGLVTPGLSLRYSHEPDYESVSVGVDGQLDLGRQNTVLRVYGEYMRDTVKKRIDTRFEDSLETVLLGASGTQVITRQLLAGVSLEAQLQRGFIANPYIPNINHPRDRNRYAASAWVGYYVEPTDTALRLAYRFYGDTWDLTGHAIDLQATQEVVPTFGVTARFRWYDQSAVFFSPRDTTMGTAYQTSDPKLGAYGSRYYELQLHWKQEWLRGTFLEPFATSRIEPSYGYLDQDNTYGPAHIAQLGWFWPY